jgi:hypothetical protein
MLRALLSRLRGPAVPILTWHGMHVAGADYGENDHAAFAADLETLHRAGLCVVPLHAIVEALRSERLDELAGCVGLSMDDGSDFDFHDLPHPLHGAQRSMLRILEDFRARHGAAAQPRLHATSFAIVDPAARAELDRTCMIGCGWWNDGWWRAAEATGLLAVESHSLDHNHETLARRATRAPAGTFGIEDAEEARVEVGEAARALRELRGRDGPVLFAYPYGDAAPFLAREWLPANGDALGIPAAFATGGRPVTKASARWELPRYVFREHWRSESDLLALLRDAGALARRGRARVAPAPGPETPVAQRAWRDHLATWEVNDARALAGGLFRRCFGHPIPDYPRHFVLVYSPPSGEEDTTPRVVAYVHQLAHEELYLCGGMCVDESAYRRMPKWLFRQVREEGGLATIVTRDSMGMLGESPASFGHVGEPRARAADLRTGFVDTGREHLMVYWRRELAPAERERCIERIAALGPF